MNARQGFGLCGNKESQLVILLRIFKNFRLQFIHTCSITAAFSQRFGKGETALFQLRSARLFLEVLQAVLACILSSNNFTLSIDNLQGDLT